jgi:hypothetical protein
MSLVRVSVFLALLTACTSSRDRVPAVDAGPGVDAGPVADSGPPADTGPVGDGGASCDFVDSLERACTTDDTCVVGLHQVDCCGSMVASGIGAAERDRFDAAEAACRATYPLCDCLPRPTETDSGETADDPSSIQVGCISGGPARTCLTYVSTRPPDTP